MPIAISCPSCEQQLRVPDNLEGKKVKCPACCYAFTITNPDPPPARAPRPAYRRDPDDDEDEIEDRPRRSSRRKPSRKENPIPGMIGGLIFLGIIGVSCYWWLGRPAKPQGTPVTVQAGQPRVESVAEWQQKAREWRDKQRSTQVLFAKLQKDKEDILRSLEMLGVTSSADLKGQPKARRYAEELREVVAQITLIRKKYDEREDAIDQMESAVRRYQRMMLVKEAGATEQELADISKTLASLEVKLNGVTNDNTVVKDLQIEELLEKELRSRKRP